MEERLNRLDKQVAEHEIRLKNVDEAYLKTKTIATIKVKGLISLNLPNNAFTKQNVMSPMAIPFAIE